MLLLLLGSCSRAGSCSCFCCVSFACSFSCCCSRFFSCSCSYSRCCFRFALAAALALAFALALTLRVFGASKPSPLIQNRLQRAGMISGAGGSCKFPDGPHGLPRGLGRARAAPHNSRGIFGSRKRLHTCCLPPPPGIGRNTSALSTRDGLQSIGKLTC